MRQIIGATVPFGSGLIDIAVRGWQACKTDHRCPIDCAGRGQSHGPYSRDRHRHLKLIFIYASIRILLEYERGGLPARPLHRDQRAGPVPAGTARRRVRVDLRVVVDEVPPPDVISRDNVSVKVSAVLYSRAADRARSSRSRTISRRRASSRRPCCAGCSTSTPSTTCWRSATSSMPTSRTCSSKAEGWRTASTRYGTQ